MKKFVILIVATMLAAGACQQGNVFSLEAGDCFNDPGSQDEVNNVEVVDCGESHDNEVYFTFDIDGSDFPGDLVIGNEASDGCMGAFEGYVGRDFFSSALDINALTPTSASWSQGDREVVCFLFDFNGAQLTTSARGTGI